MKRKLLSVTMLAVMACGLNVAWAQPETSTDTGRPRHLMRGAGPTDREMELATEFMQEHAPNRWRAIEMLPEDGPIRRSLAAFVVARYRTIAAIKDEDPKLYENKVAQLTVEDDLYGLLSATTNPEEREKVRPKLKELLQKMVTLNIQEREQRIARLREQLSGEEQRLAADKGRTESFVNNRVEQMIAEGTGALRRDMMPRQEGRRQRPTSQPAGRQPR